MESLTSHKRKNVLRTFTIGLLVSLIIACSPGEGGDLMLDENSDGSSIELSLDKNLIITLESNPSTGFTWQMFEVDASILEKVGENEFTPLEGEEIALGSGGKERLTFRAISPGKTTLKLAYKQPWDDQAQPEKLFTVEVTVK